MENPAGAGHPAAEETDVFVMPCSTSQKRFWMLEQMSPGDTALVIPIAVQLSGPLRVDVLERALNKMVSRHEILRTSFALVEDEPRQIIAAEAALTLHRLDLGGVAPEERQKRVAEVMSAEAEKPVPLTEAPLLRATLVQLAPEEAVLMLTAHHIVSDGWSNGLLVRELGVFYHALLKDEAVDLPPLAIQYADYVLWQEEWLKSPEFEKQLEFWKEELSGEFPVLDFPTDFARRGAENHEAILESRLLPAALTEALKNFCREEGTTLFMVFFSAYIALLHRYTGQERLMVGTTGANRNKPELEALIGLFSNILLLRSDVSRGMSFRKFLARQRDHLLNSFANHEAPFERVLEQLQAGKKRLPKTLVQTHFLFQKAFMQPMEKNGLTIRPLYSVSPGSTFELTFGIVERAEGIRLQMEYWTSLFRQSTIQRVLGHFQALLEAVVASPETALAELPLFMEGEREELEAGLAQVEEGNEADDAFDPESIFRDLDAQIDSHFLSGDAPFTKVKLPPGCVLLTLDDQLQFMPAGIPGRLYLGAGAGGWGGRSDTVRGPEGFTPDLLKTDFVGRHAEGGGLEVWGRTEDVIGLPVFRFNRRAIEVRLRSHPEVSEAAVVVEQQASGEAKLAACVVPRPGAHPTAEEVKRFLRGKISDLLVPSTILIVEAISRDAEGKVILGTANSPAVTEIKIAPHAVPLQGILQQQLLEVWRQILKTSDVTIDDNFFELGGNSFLALRMMVEAGKIARRPLPLSLLLTGATVANLSRFILEGQGEAEAATPLVAVQPKGSRPPLFFLHGDWVGGGFYCNRIAQKLGEDQPFYALPPFRAPGDAVVSIAQMAAWHRAEIRKQSPRGPYVLGGYCIGSLVAMEVARQLAAEGATVTHLFLVDPPLLADAWVRPIWPLMNRGGELLNWNLEKRIGWFDRYPVALSRWLKRPLGSKMGFVRRLVGWRQAAAPQASAAPGADQESGHEQGLEGIDYSLYFLAYRLHKIARLAIPATLFVPEATSKERLRRIVRATKMDPARFKIKLVPGNHTTCVTEDISAMAEEMRNVLAPS